MSSDTSQWFLTEEITKQEEIMAVETLTDETFASETATGTVLVDFWAEWCTPCKMIAPIVEELSSEIPEVKFGKVDIEENQAVTQSLGITTIPTLVLYKEGKPVDQVVGTLPKAELKSFLQKHL